MSAPHRPLAFRSQTPEVQRAKTLIQDALLGAVNGDPPDWVTDAPDPDPAVADDLEDLLQHPDTYRSGLLAVYAYGVAVGNRPDYSMPEQIRGPRGVGSFVQAILPHLGIPGTRGNPMDTRGKSDQRIDLTDRPAWNRVVQWGTTATVEQRRAVLAFVCRRLAALARPLPAMPELITSKCTWARTAKVFDTLIDASTTGAAEQYSVAALVQAVNAEDIAKKRFHVTTKALIATDQAARVAGDVQLRRGDQTVYQAWEVTGGRWRSKIDQAVGDIDREALSDITILAREDVAFPQAVEAAIQEPGHDLETYDIAAVNLREWVRVLVAGLSKQHRREALRALYRLGRQYGEEDLVIQLVRLLHDTGLAET